MIKVRQNILDKEKKSTIIVQKVKDIDIYQHSNVIALYKSMNSEVDTSNFLNDDKIFLLPRIDDDNLVFLSINKDTKYQKSKFGVLEPIIDNNIYKGKIDLIIVPGVAFDKDLNRLGYGKGYYDRFLAKKDIYKIGLGFDEQLVDTLITNQHDIKMDMIVTEKRLIKIQEKNS